MQEIIAIAPDWQRLLESMAAEGQAGPFELFNRLGAPAIYRKALSLTTTRASLLVLLRNYYFQTHLQKMLSSNQNLRRFWSQRRVEPAQQKEQAVSLSIDLAQKMEGVLGKRLAQEAADGFKVLLPAYIQRSVQNAVVDYIRQEWSWEKHTLQDLNLDPEQEDPRHNVADAQTRMPENLAISNEQVKQINQLRQQLEVMLKDPNSAREPLTVLDCMFGLGLTSESTAGQEMTMKECCQKLKIGGETQARQIARCQVLLDKALDMVRQQIREKLPGIADAWQSELNVNRASRRELSQQLGMTEGEVERLVKLRQYQKLDELVEKGVIKAQRLSDLAQKGAVAAFIPIDVNLSTSRDLIDILGLPKEVAQKIVMERPFPDLVSLVSKKLLDKPTLDSMLKRGAALTTRAADSKRLDLNRVEVQAMLEAGIPDDIAKLAERGRPFLTWSELEDFLACDTSIWLILRQKFCLGLVSG